MLENSSIPPPRMGIAARKIQERVGFRLNAITRANTSIIGARTAMRITI